MLFASIFVIAPIGIARVASAARDGAIAEKRTATSAANGSPAEAVPRSSVAAAAGENYAEVRTPDVWDEMTPLRSEEPRVSVIGIVAGLVAFALLVWIPALSLGRKYAIKRRITRLNWRLAVDTESMIQKHHLRLLPNKHFSNSGSAALEKQMEIAAKASVEFGRQFGVIYFNIAHANLTTSDAEIASLLSDFRRSLRDTDHVACLNEDELIICVSLLPGLTELTKIAERMQRIGRTRLAATFERPGGLSIYPICGYQADELIEHARARYFKPIATVGSLQILGASSPQAAKVNVRPHAEPETRSVVFLSNVKSSPRDLTTSGRSTGPSPDSREPKRELQA